MRRREREMRRLRKRDDTLKRKGAPHTQLQEVQHAIQQLHRIRRRIPSGDPFDGEYKRLYYCRYADDFVVRPEVAYVEWSEGAPSLVSRAVSNPSLRHWQQ
jgi:hypothetical protein